MNKGDQDYQTYKKRKILRILMIIFYFLTIVLSLFALTNMLPFWVPLISFVIATILTSFRDKMKYTKEE